MKRIKYYGILLALILLIGIGAAYFVKSRYIHLDYNKYIQNAFYSYNDLDVERQVRALEDYIFEEQDDIDDLYEFSEAIYVVKSVNVDYEKNCIINRCNVIQTIKGERKESIEIYDLSRFWNENYAEYLGNLTPMKKGETYLIFLHYIENEDRFVFSSKKYGHINIESSNYYFNISEHDLTLKEAMEYDCIFNKYVFNPDLVEDVEITEDDLHDYEDHVRNYLNKCGL